MNEWHMAKTSVSTSPLSGVYIKKWGRKKSQKGSINGVFIFKRFTFTALKKKKKV